MQVRLWSLTLGNFAIGTGAMIVPGMLNELSADLAVTPAQIGMLISAFAATVCLGGPFLASWTSAIERRRLLAGALVLYALMHLLAAFAPGYGSLLAVRMVTAVGAALFTAQAAATVGLMVPPEARGKAIGMVFLGWSIAAVVGTPIGAYLGAHIGWRPTLGLVGLVSALFAAAVWRQIPAGLFVAPIDRAAWKAVFADTPLLLAVSVTALQAIGLFIVFSYMALVLKDFIGATPTAISLLFLCFGITGVIGNVIAARVMDRVGPVRVGMVAMGCMLAALAAWPLARGSLPMTIVLTLIWGLGCFAINGSQQVRLIMMAPQLAAASVALNSSAIYMGQALGALLGGVIVTSLGTVALSYFGTVPMALAMAVSLYAANMSERRATLAASCES
ncbi:MFS transporter [Noviherbaspirillum cavernae]|uniref:MFS transporter n=1 Tax=Noviherbaspirillum cavernae TaxID=2320862 RepID=A0A418X5Q6_9BURK|nr:MFS transporter [Noviherbaspirillum cavernae]RJG04631.1 MFS transporter [Noviherbaspirillum cavernae]RJG07715.1 MFS transporter [Noviherbaspirillum cavernae]RJG07716.1 MFS transporter [Noviherbaspirillum cavernae]